VLEALSSLGSVGGNQSRYLFDFSPASVILRVTHDPAPRMMFAFDGPSHPRANVHQIIQLIEAGDLEADGLIIGGEAARWEEVKQLREYGVAIHIGVKEAFLKAKERLV
jgi:CRISPR-associated protein Cst2